jgi:hypothetical protein
MIIADSTSNLKSPLEIAQKLSDHADAALGGLDKITPTKSKELQYTVNDIKSMAHLGKYYSYKIEGATDLTMYRKTKNVKYQVTVIENLKHALTSWEKYSKTVELQNKNPLWTNRVGYVDFQQITEWVVMDIEIANKSL